MAIELGKLKTATGPWLVAAIIVVGGFMYWLYASAGRIDTGVVVADTVIELPRVADTTFVANPEQFSGDRILLAPVTIADTLGTATVTIDLPGLAGYPLILERSVLEAEITVVPGDAVAIAGSVYALTDSLLDVYVQRGFFRRESRALLEGQTTFFLVDSLDYYAAEDTTTGEPGS
jgi:hypothetical protein